LPPICGNDAICKRFGNHPSVAKIITQDMASSAQRSQIPQLIGTVFARFDMVNMTGFLSDGLMTPDACEFISL
jgi:hypothetical protein